MGVIVVPVLDCLRMQVASARRFAPSVAVCAWLLSGTVLAWAADAPPTATPPATTPSAETPPVATPSATTPLGTVGVQPSGESPRRSERSGDSSGSFRAYRSSGGYGHFSFPVSAKILRYAERIVRQYDTNGDDRLQAEEWQAMRGEPATMDFDRDGTITIEEYSRYIFKYGRAHRIHLAAPPAYVESPPALFQPAAGGQLVEPEPEEELWDEDMEEEDELEFLTRSSNDRSRRRAPRSQQKFYVPRSKLPPGLPEWFVQRDADGDGQVTLAEVAPDGGQAAALEFFRYDSDRDGLITPKELLKPGKSSSFKQKSQGAAGSGGGSARTDRR